MKKILIIGLGFFFLGLSSKQIQAQEMALSLYPPLLEVTIQPGRSITQVYQLSNQGETDMILNSRLVPFTPSNEIGGVLLREQETSEAQPWISFQNADLALGQSFVLKAKGEQQLVLKIKVPEQATEDDYYLTLLLFSQSESNHQQNSVQSQIKIGSHLLLTLSQTGEPPKKAQVEDFKIQNAWFRIGSWQFIDSFTNPLFILRLKNLGRSLFKPMGNLTVSGFSGQKYLLDLLPENILVNSTRQTLCFSADKNQPLPCRLNLGWKNKFLIGSYQVTVTFGLNKVSEEYRQTFNFFAFPFFLTAGLIFLIVFFWLMKKRS